MPNGIAQSMAATQYAAHEAQRRSPETTEQGTAAVPMAPTAVVQVNQATHTDVVQGTAGNEHAAQQLSAGRPRRPGKAPQRNLFRARRGTSRPSPKLPAKLNLEQRAVWIYRSNLRLRPLHELLRGGQ